MIKTLSTQDSRVLLGLIANRCDAPLPAGLKPASSPAWVRSKVRSSTLGRRVTADERTCLGSFWTERHGRSDLNLASFTLLNWAVASLLWSRQNLSPLSRIRPPH